MGPSIATYLRTHRRKSGLTQRELAILLGLQGGQIISRYEHLSRIPNLRSAMACQVLFDVEPRELFPRLFADIEQLTIERIRALSEHEGDRPLKEADIYRNERLEQVIRRSTLRSKSL